jgi:hypothetical protein
VWRQELYKKSLVFEVDFVEITGKKALVISKNDDLKTPISPIQTAAGEVHSSQYHLIAGDLREWPKVVEKLHLYGFDSNLPTLFISECVMVYMSPEASDALLQWIGQLPDSIVVAYEQILPNDAFGKMMVQNLKSRNLDLLGVNAYPTLKAQKERYLKAGFKSAHAIDMDECYEKYVSPAEKARLSSIEKLDEVEEWRLLGQHYCLAWAWKNDEYSSIHP